MKTTQIYTMKRGLFMIKAIMAGLLVAAFNQSCTNLDETLYSEVTPKTFPTTEAELNATMGNIYTTLGGYASGDVNNLQEVTTDEMVVPTRGSDWEDGGNWRRLHFHSWKFEDNATGGAWDFCFTGVTSANALIYQFQTLTESGTVDANLAATYIAELQSVRGFFYWQLLDLYGNVPIVTDFVGANPTPPTVARKDVYDFVVNELETAVPSLLKAVDGSTYSRMTYWAGKALLAKIYLNAGVYTGTPEWQKAIDECDEIINSGKFNLESDYFTNFNAQNQASKEFIFAIPYDHIFFKGFNLDMQTLHYGSQFTYNLSEQPWNGFCTLEEFYNSYSDNDLRKGDVGTLTTPAVKRGNFLAGYQFKSDGTVILDPNAETNDPDGQTLNFGSMGSGQPQINEAGPQAIRQAGVRIGKWEFARGSTRDLDNDFAIFRYADVLLMKAEALWRLGRTAEALPLVNMIRARAGLTDLASLDGPVSFDMGGPSVPGGELLNEMGREMFAEHNRRQDLIRWGLFTSNDKWALPTQVVGDVLKTDPYTTIFPINRSKLDANPNLVQNPGYETK